MTVSIIIVSDHKKGGTATESLDTRRGGSNGTEGDGGLEVRLRG